MKKKDTDMGTKRSKTSLRVHCHTVPTLNKGGNLVIACGYSVGLKFGYFICTETVDKTGHFVYSDVKTFLEKVDNHTYQQALTEYNRLTST
jgi:hypothetical protein